ncbi:ATP-binding protein [Streptomyces sp. NPDC046909]|uniref:sensor histidine kinase n=1 Tax=Streptomyces sp. NPDC046909 TaxID=3155617 RepID=UPI00340177D0
MTAPTLPGERPTFRTFAPAPLLTAVLATAVVVAAVAAAPDSVRVPLACGAGAGALLLVAAVAMAAHAVQTVRLTRRRLEAVTLDAGRLLQERARQSAEFDRERVSLTEELTHERARLTSQADLERARLTAEFAAERTRLSTSFAEERDRVTAEAHAERARLTAENARLTEQSRKAAQDRAAAVSATANAAGRMQALATGMLADLRAMEERHDDEDVLADLLHLDHRAAQAGRLADSVAVLTGARSGRRWARPIAMESILRGAMGRISGYRRVRVHSASEAAVAGHAAEGVMHALAELLDNAANFSPPTAEVHVYVEEVPAGVILSAEDSGLVMSEVQLRRAERAVEGEAAGLGGLTGTRLGLAVVGRLALKYGLKVSYRPSARGGTGVLMLVPQDILVPQDAPLPQDALALPQPPAAGAERSKPDAADAPAETETATDAQHATADPDPDPVPAHESPSRDAGAVSDGLPRRHRGRALAAAERERERARARAAEFDRERERERTRARAGQDDEPGPFPTPDTAFPASLDDPLTRAARFSNFRRAVRGSLSDQDATPPAEDIAVHTTTPDTAVHTTATHPEGNPT